MNCFQTKCSSLFTDEQRAYPSRITAQRRHRHRRAVGTRCEDSFQIKTLHKPFLMSLVVYILRILNTTEKDAGVIGMWPRQNIARTWTTGAYYKGHCLSPIYIIKTEYLRECSASRVWPYMHQLRVMIFVKCWVARLLCSAALRSALSAKAAQGELLRLCCESSGRAPL